MKEKLFSILDLLTPICIILIFQLIDMLSSGPIIFFSNNNIKLSSEFIGQEKETLKNLGSLVYVYSSIISMIFFGLITKMEATIVSGPIVESLRPMIDAYSENILLETDTVNGYFTNFIVHLLVTTLGFAVVSLGLYYINQATLLEFIPKSVINGCLAAIGIGQLYIAIDCIQGTDETSEIAPHILWVAIFCVLVYLILDKSFEKVEFLIPAYIIILIVIFYILASFSFGAEGEIMSQIREKGWVASSKPLIYPNYILNKFEPSTISLKALGKNFLGIISTIFISSIHIAVNLPAYKMATGIEFDFSSELGTQGFSNIFTVLPCYFIVSYSIATYKSGGTRKIYTIIAAFSMIIIALYGVMIKGFIPKFVLSLVPGIMFVSFMTSSLYHTIYYISFYEYALSVMVCIIIMLTKQYIYGLMAGFILYFALFNLFSGLSYKRIKSVKDDIVTENNTDIIKMDHMLWFYTANVFAAKIDETDRKQNCVLDFQKCSAIDWIGQDYIAKVCDKYENVTFIGNPFNLRHKRFSKIDNFFYYSDYEAYNRSLSAET